MSTVDIKWLLEPIVLLICDNLNDMDKLCFISTSRYYRTLLNKIYFNTNLSLEKLKTIPYSNRFKSVEVTGKQIKYLLLMRNLNLSTVIILCSTNDYFCSDHAEIITKLNIRELIFKNDFASCSNYKIECKIPETVKILKFFNGIKCSPKKFPSDLNVLFFNQKQNFKKGGIISLSEKLTHLHNLNYDRYHAAIPKSVISLSLIATELNNILPLDGSIIYLKLNVTKQIMPNMIPVTVKDLTFSYNYKSKILPGVIPPNVTHLNFIDLIFFCAFRQRIDVGILPQTLQSLKFDMSYQKSPHFIYELINLTHLEFYGSESNQLDVSKISTNITHLSTNIYSSEKKMHNNITHLSICSYVVNDVLNYLPDNLNKLTFILHQNSDLNISKYVPLNVINVVVKNNTFYLGYDENISIFIKNLPNTVQILKLVKFNLFEMLPENIVNFKIRKCTFTATRYLHDKITRLSVPESTKYSIYDKIKSKIRIRYYKNN